MNSNEPLPDSTDVVIIGGGIAGLATAAQLGRFGVTRTVLLEAEPMLGEHSSANNAAIYRPLEESDAAIVLAARSCGVLDSALGTSWLRACGLVLMSGERGRLDGLRYRAQQWDLFHEYWDDAKLRSRVPFLTAEGNFKGIFVPMGGEMDVDRILGHMEQLTRESGIAIHTGCRVREITTKDSSVTGVVLEDGHAIEADKVVIAGGAWASELGKTAGAPLPLAPLRRHLVVLDTPDIKTRSLPVVWRLEDEVYARPEGGGLLASPCDEVQHPPGRPGTDPGQVERLADKLRSLGTPLEKYQVRKSWACLRTQATDNEFAIGNDPRVEGLAWIAGLGGRGISCGVGAGEMLAAILLGADHPLREKLDPKRLL